MSRRLQVHLSPILGVKEQKCLTGYTKENEALQFSRNCHPNKTENKHVYEIYCRLEVDGDVISSRNVRTIWGEGAKLW